MMSILRTATSASLFDPVRRHRPLRPDQPVAPGPSSDWRPLFDGRSLDGWEHVGPGKFVVENGVLRTEGGMGLLWYSREKLGNCVIRVVYKTANDALELRRLSPDRRSTGGPVVRSSPRVRGADHGPGSEGRSTGSIYTFAKAAAKPFKAGEWTTLEITLAGKPSSPRSTAQGHRVRLEQLKARDHRQDR